MRDDMTLLGSNRPGRTPLAAATLLLGLALTALAPAPVAAQMSAEEACKPDAFRLCNDAIPDRDKVGACLRRNARSLSPACRTFVVGGGRQYTGRGRVHVRPRVHHYYHRRQHTYR
jgi:hypothetical protein